MANKVTRGRVRERGEGGLILRGRIWWAQYYLDGEQVRVSTKCRVKAEAAAFLRKIIEGLDKGEVPFTETRKVPYSALRQGLIDNYNAEGRKSLRERADGTEGIAGLKALDEFCGFKQEVVDGELKVTEHGVSADKITTDFATRFVKERQKAGVGNAAINRSLAALRRMLNLAKRANKIHSVPFIQFLKEPSARKGFLEPEKFAELVKLLPTHLKPLVIFLYDTGVRIGEALQISWGQVSLDERTITLEGEQTKNSEARTVPILSELHNLLSQEPRTQGPVFDATNLRKEWVKACVAAGLGVQTEVEGKPYDPRYEGLTIHDLRRSGVRNLVRSGVSETVARKISGHKTQSVFQRYNITSNEDVVNAAQAVEQYRLKRVRAKMLEGRVAGRKRLAAKAGE